MQNQLLEFLIFHHICLKKKLFVLLSKHAKNKKCTKISLQTCKKYVFIF